MSYRRNETLSLRELVARIRREREARLGQQHAPSTASLSRRHISEAAFLNLTNCPHGLDARPFIIRKSA